MERLIVYVFIILSFYTSGHYCRLFCLNCTNVANYTECSPVLCTETEYCKFERKSVNKTHYYTLGCEENQQCHTVKSTTLTTVTTTPALSTTTAVTTAHTTITTTPDFDNTTTDDPSNSTANGTTTTNYITSTSMPGSQAGTVTITPDPSLTRTVNIPTHTPNALQVDHSHHTSTIPSAGIKGKRYLSQLTSEDLDDVIIQTEDSCLECCEGSVCNTYTLACVPGKCYDVFGKDACSKAIHLLDVCKNITFAKKMCKETCQLCNLTDGNWASWSGWTECSVTCGNGTHLRTRNCTDPAPANKGEACAGDRVEKTSCEMEACPTDGNWGPWDAWSECSKTCGVGLRFKDRICNQPAPDQDGLFCQGEPRDYEVCMNDTCEDGHWDLWSNWTECSATCGLGQKTRLRKCSVPEVLGPVCFGDSREKEMCNFTDCKDGQWGEWSNWTACSSTCGVGLKTRSRDCGSQLGHSCVGPNTESSLCHTSECDDAMSAFATTGVPMPGGQNYTLKFTLVLTNVGDDYNNDTGMFTCRIPGLYQFFVSIEKQINVSQAHCRLMVNNSSTILIAARSAFVHADAFQQASNSLVLDLKKGEIVYLGYCSDPSTMTKEGVFSGSLISRH